MDVGCQSVHRFRMTIVLAPYVISEGNEIKHYDRGLGIHMS